MKKDFRNALIAGMIWTALEAGAVAITMYTDGEVTIQKAVLGVLAAVMIFVAKTLKLGFPMIDEDTMKDEEDEQDD